ncbi:MAG: efflux RND transporter periplasmic adaptor subunit [Wenzhouxiangella sp.]
MSRRSDTASSGSGRPWLRQLLASLAVLALAVGLAAYFLLTGSSAPRGESRSAAVLVEVIDAPAQALRPSIDAHGELQPARALSLPAQVGGRVVSVHPALVLGGRVAAGATLVELEKADFELAVAQASARLEDARAELELEQGRQASARQELESFRESDSNVEADDKLSLILREPQLRRTRAAIERAQAELEQARLNLARATVTAPFDSIVDGEEIEIGQVLQPGSPVAELLGTETAHVLVPIPARHLPHLKIPGWNAENGSRGTARYRLGDIEVDRPIRILHLAGSLDPAGRMPRLVLEMDDPLGLEQAAGERDDAGSDPIRPMLFGAFVDVEIELAAERELVELPAGAIRNRDRLFVMTDDGTLAIRQPEIFLRRDERVYLSDGLEPGDRVVTSMIANPIEGMELRTDAADDASEAQ